MHAPIRSPWRPWPLGPALISLLLLLLATMPTAAAQTSRGGEPLPGPARPQTTLVSEALDGPRQVSAQVGPSDPAEVGAFLDAQMAGHLAEHQVPGSTVAVVQGGRLLVARGYGFADRERQAPVVAERTLFRPGSVSKLFTWTAVLQLVEEGRLDLHADVNSYLRAFQVPATYPQPITLAHLLTHTAGFEDRGGLWVEHPDQLLPLGAYLANTLPARVRPPGELPSYSNHGTVLAGHIVEEVSGLPFERYVEDRILRPAGMTRSTFAQPAPAGLAENLAVGYLQIGDTPQPQPVEYFQATPAGALSATGPDMARFMLAHLQGGRVESAQILRPETVREMHRTQVTNDPRLPGLTYGFKELVRNGQRLLIHEGDSLSFHSLLALVPEQNVGLFVSYNAAGGRVARSQLLQAFLDRYYPSAAAPAPAVMAGATERMGPLTGSYLMVRRSHTTVSKARSLLQTFTVSTTPEGHLLLPDASFRPRPFVEVEGEPLLFREVDGQGLAVFRQDEGGRITHLLVDHWPSIPLEKAAWSDALPTHMVVLGFALAGLVSALLALPIASLVGRLRGGPSRGWAPGAARGLAWVTGLLAVVFGLGFAVEGMGLLAYTPPPALLVGLLMLPLLIAGLTVGLVVCVVLAWRHGYWNRWWRAHYTLVTLAAITLLVWLSHWNLLGYRF